MGFFAEFRQLTNHLDFRLMMTNATSTAKPCREKTLTKGLSFNYGEKTLTKGLSFNHVIMRPKRKPSLHHT